MNESKGNNPELFSQLLSLVDEKLQLGLLDALKKIHSYHFEDETLFLKVEAAELLEYLKRDAVFQQLSIFAKDACQVERVKVEHIES